MLEPLVDDAGLVGFGERVGREALEAPVAVLDMTAADHVDQLLATSLGDVGEVVVEARDRLEVNVELDASWLEPLVARSLHVSRPHRRTSHLTVDVQQRL